MNSTCNKDHHGFSSFICKVIDSCNMRTLNLDQREIIIELLSRLQDFRKYYGYNDMLLTSLLNQLGSHLQDSHLSHYSLNFYQEELRIEKLHLGPSHPDLALTLYDIGQVFAENEQLFIATEYFTEAFFLLEKSNKKGKLLALTLFKLGLLKCESSPVDAMKLFQSSIKTLQNTLGEFHPDIAEMYLLIGKLQLQSGKKFNAMDSFLQAIMIRRLSTGNNCTEVGELLYNIGLCHKNNGEDVEALNSFYQSLEIMKRFQHKECIIMMLYEIFLIHKNFGDIEKAVNALHEIISIVKEKVGEKHICIAIILGQLYTLYLEQGMTEESKKVSKNIDIICNMSRLAPCDSNHDLINLIIELFGHVFKENSKMIAAAAAA